MSGPARISRWRALGAALAAVLAAPPAAAAPEGPIAALPLQHAADVSEAHAEGVRAALRAALVRAGHAALPLAEVDRLLVATDLSCTTAACLARSTRVLGARLLVGGRLERESPGDAAVWSVTLWVYDGSSRSTVATLRDQCGACSAAEVRGWVGGVVQRLMAERRASRGSAWLLVHATPAGATVSIDGSRVGVSGMRFGVAPGRHTVTVAHAGYRLSVHEVELPPGKGSEIRAVLEPSPEGALVGHPGAEPAGSWLLAPRVLRWVTLGAAAAGLAAGIPLLALDDRGTCDASHPLAECPRQRDLLVPGVVLTAIGGLAAGASGYFFYAAADADRPARTAAVVPLVLRGGGGVSTLLTF